MEPEVYCYDNTKNSCCCRGNRRSNCLLVVIGIFLVAFAVSLGILIGSLAATAITAARAALIVFIVVAALLLLVSIILYLCQRRKNCRDR